MAIGVNTIHFKTINLINFVASFKGNYKFILLILFIEY